MKRATKRFLFSLPLRDREEKQVGSPHEHRKGSNDLSREESKEAMFSLISDKITPGKHGVTLTRLTLPDFKIGTLDALVGAGEDLAKSSSQFEGILDRLVGHLKALFENDESQIISSLVVDEHTPGTYLDNFRWNSLKYRTDVSVREISDVLLAEATQIDTLIKGRMNAYYQDKAAIDAVLKAKSGNLMVRCLGDVLGKADIVNDSEYMETLLVVVPKNLLHTWEESYEKLCPMVVPNSAKVLAQDHELLLFSVVIFKKFRQDFVTNATAKKFVIRPLPTQSAESSEENNLEDSERKLSAQWSQLVRLVQTNFGEAFAAYCHLLVLRMFVESVLAYGLPAQYLFVSAKLEGDKRKFDKAFLGLLESLRLPGISLVDLATALHRDGGGDASAEAAEESELWTALNVANKHFDPYVAVPIKVDYH